MIICFSGVFCFLLFFSWVVVWEWSIMHWVIESCVCERCFLVINRVVKKPCWGLKWADRQACLFAPSRRVFAGLASTPGVWLQSSWAPAQPRPLPSLLPASHARFAPTHNARLPFLIKQAHKTTFLEFFMCRLLSVFTHAWMGCTEKCRLAALMKGAVTSEVTSEGWFSGWVALLEQQLCHFRFTSGLLPSAPTSFFEDRGVTGRIGVSHASTIRPSFLPSSSFLYLPSPISDLPFQIIQSHFFPFHLF